MKLSETYKKHRVFINYFCISCFVTIVDILVSRLSEKFCSEVIANTIGVTIGFIIQYLLCSKNVYNRNDLKTLIAFFFTWLIGLGFADLIIYIIRVKLFNSVNSTYVFLLAKFFSILLPFFLTYYLRKKLIN